MLENNGALVGSSLVPRLPFHAKKSVYKNWHTSALVLGGYKKEMN